MDHETILRNLTESRRRNNFREQVRWQKIAYLNKVPGFEYVATWDDWGKKFR